MKSINPIYLTPDVKHFVKTLINDYDYDSYECFSHADKCEFAGHLINSLGKDAEAEFLTESQHLSQTICVFQLSLRGKMDDDDFLFTLKENTVRYFDDTMEAIFNDIFESQNNDAEEILTRNISYSREGNSLCL